MNPPFGRVITAMVTPFTPEGQVDYETAARLANHLVEHGSEGLVVCGTTGESPALTWDEEYQLFQVVLQSVDGRASVIAGTGSNSTREAIAATAKAAKLGVHGSLQVCPYYNKPPQEGLYQHFKAIAENADIPLILYNIPGRTGVNLLPETVARLAEIRSIIGIKEASGSIDQASSVRALTSSDFLIYAGDDALTLPLLSVGAHGVISVASHLAGPQMQQMLKAFIAGNVYQAQTVHQRLLPLFKALFLTTNPIPVKCALEMMGWPVGQPRLPLVQAPETVREQLSEVLKTLSLI
ncbi:MAG: 4-hydroxy-tetrahydrodipicolinate synthase [Gloeobacterales cyanobacterium]